MNGFQSSGDFYSRPKPEAIGSPVLQDQGEFERTPELPHTHQVPPAYNMRFDEYGRDTFAPGVPSDLLPPQLEAAPPPSMGSLPLIAAAAFVAFLLFKDNR